MKYLRRSIRSVARPNVAFPDVDLADIGAFVRRTLHDAAPAAARVDADPNAGGLGRSITHVVNGRTGSRTYVVYLPRDYRGQACPLVVMLHGCTQSPGDFARGTRMNVHADEATCLVAYPEQPASANASKCWNWFEPGDQQRDSGEPALLARMVEDIAGRYAVDRDRVYVAGLSAGGAAAAVLGATYPDIFAAVGVHSGLICGLARDMPTAFAAMRGGEGPAPARPLAVPTIVFHGDRDTTVHPRNGERFLTAQLRSGSRTRVTQGSVAAGHTFTTTTCTDDRGRDVFAYWVVHGSAHAWSGGNASGSYVDPQGPDASAEMLRFFLTHRRERSADRHPTHASSTSRRA
ncbi:MAG: hypothetical protein PVSMB8_05370 [Vulcanimicrobiaceae bacterium]